MWDSYVHVPDGGKSLVKDGHIDLAGYTGIGVELNLEGVHKHAVPGYGIFD